ncbi:proprotein convertase subtilisin/kexin type 5, partial [Austrofundulus limnaeus]|uniref:Proprotein convertase subtilisin/kexin type 5 n=1 Tax=Austrofundulus limnaeus TaxID=52670 RepID=A0A2I4B2B2_AUSLI
MLFFTLWMGALLQFCPAMIYTNNWALKIRGDLELVNRIAEKYGFTNMGQIGDLKSYYSFRHLKTANHSTESNTEVTNHIAKETKVEWLQQQVVHRRAKRTSGKSHVYSSNIEPKD